MLSTENLNAGQIAFYNKYRQNSYFAQILNSKGFNDRCHLIDYFRLVENEIIQKVGKDLYGGVSQEALEVYMNLEFKKIVDHKKDIQNKAILLRKAFSEENEWTTKIVENTTPDDLTQIDILCRTLAKNDHDADAMLLHFFNHVVQAKITLKQHRLNDGRTLDSVLESLSPDWYKEPWYYTYVQYFGAEKGKTGTFDNLRLMLDYLESIGIKNIYILPHYQSPNGDAGYDISDYVPSEDLGGTRAFTHFLDEAISRGFRIATDLVFNHTSVEHGWFQMALKGVSKYFDFYLKCPGNWENLNLNDVLRDENGDLYLYLPEIDQSGKPVISKRVLIFPDVDKTLWLKKQVKGLNEPVLFYREFYPFQVDLDLQHPSVIEALFKFLAEEVSMGILGKRTDAIAHWIKKPGTNAKDLPETYALQTLIKYFLKHISSKTIILPEVVTTSKKLLEYGGKPVIINNHLTTTGGDALLDFQLQGMLREMIYFQKTSPFWTQIHDRGTSHQTTAVPLLPIEHHDETYMGFIQEIQAMREYISGHYEYRNGNGMVEILKRGIIYKNGMSGGARYADCLNQDQRRIAMAFFCLYLMPAVPVIYFGTEIGATNQWEQVKIRQIAQFETLKSLLTDSQGNPLVGFEKCEDPRELQRGSIPASSFYEALSNGYPAVQLIKWLNHFRKERTALRSPHLTHIDTYHPSLFGIIRYPANPQEPILLALVNLSHESLTAQISPWQLNQKIGGKCNYFRRVLGLWGENTNGFVMVSDYKKLELDGFKNLAIQAPPYGAFLFEVHVDENSIFKGEYNLTSHL